jgi:hypothetical protein
MPERPDKRRRKEMLRGVREQQRAEARAALPLPDDQLRAMFDTLDRELPIRGCDHTRRLTQEFLERSGHPIEAVLAWLDENGGYCDCEVLANVEERWLDCREDKSRDPKDLGMD